KNSEAIYAQQAQFYAVSVAHQYIEEAKKKAFDEFTIVGNPGTMPSGFTSAPMGKGAGENYPNFDDVDDFNNFTTTLSTALGDMTITILVNYVSEANLDSIVDPTKTFYKRMQVQVVSSYLSAPVFAEHIFGFQKNE
ncbi:MAG: hypothetical protein ACE5IR_12345, partial [bacterium]